MLRSKVEQNELLEEQLRNADAEKVGEAKEIPYCKEGPTSGATYLKTFHKRFFAFDLLFFRRTSQAPRSTAANALYYDLPSCNAPKCQLQQTRLYLNALFYSTLQAVL